MQIVVNTIVRQRAKNLPAWHSQLVELATLSPDIQFDLVVVENNSTDSSKELLKTLDFSALHSYKYILEDFPNAPYYGSIKSLHRVQLLEAQRNKCLDASKELLATADKILFLEPDVVYDPAQVVPLLHSTADIVAPASFQNGVYYDTWCCRRTDQDKDWNEPPPKQETTVWGLWNQLTVCKAAPIRDNNIRFTTFNKRFNNWDNEVSCFVESFHEVGCHDVRIAGNISIEHKGHYE